VKVGAQDGASTPITPRRQRALTLDLFFGCCIGGGVFILVAAVFVNLVVLFYPWLVPLLNMAAPFSIPGLALGCLPACLELRWMLRVIAGERVSITVRRQYAYVYGLMASFAAFSVLTNLFLLLSPSAPPSSLSPLIPLAVAVSMGFCMAMAFTPLAALAALSAWARMKGQRLLWRLLPNESRLKGVAEISLLPEQGEAPGRE